MVEGQHQQCRDRHGKFTSYMTHSHGVLRIQQTGGYPSTGTREFLNILWTQLPRSGPQAVKFLYCSDHDAYGIHLYCLLRWGARISAATSRTMVCPGLQWVGPTQETVLSRLERYMRHTWTLENRHKSLEENLRALNQAKEDVRKRMQGKLTSKANSILRCMEKVGYMDLDPVINLEVAALRAGNAVRTKIPFKSRMVVDV